MTSSVTVCSTWIRVFISMKKYSPSRVKSPSIVPAERYPAARAASTAMPPIRARSASSTAGEGVSSTSF